MEYLALQLRREWGIDNYAPIDIYSLVSEKIDNLPLAWLEMDGIISGCSLKSEDDFLIIINSIHSKGRQNFTLAHELYHLYFDEANYSYCQINSNDAIEKEANMFASYFLMPKCALEDYHFKNKICQWTLKDMVKCEQLFHISHRALLTRLHEENYIDDESFERFRSPKFSIRNYAAHLGFDTTLYEKSPKSKRNYVLGNIISLAEKEYQKGEISKGYINEIFLKIFREDLVYDIKGDKSLD